MRRVNRRGLLASLGSVGGTTLLAGCDVRSWASRKEQKAEGHSEGSRQGSQPGKWVYVELDQQVIAKRAYELFPHGGCMYALTGSIVTTLGEMVGEPYRSFPFQMMQYGAGGTSGWGTLCGALNGAGAMIGLIHAKKEIKAGARPVEAFPWYGLVEEIFRWYETTELPEYQPERGATSLDIPPSVSASVLCHVSLNNWSKVSGHEAFTPERQERCRRLTADVARKTVEVLNLQSKDTRFGGGLPSDVKSCMECHGKRGRADSFGKMTCGSCHEFPREHP